MTELKQKPVLFAILDGWGIGKQDNSDAVFMANTPNIDKILEEYPNTQILTSGRDVGLPKGIMGNSEVGHQNIGAGRIVYQSLTKINVAIEDGSFFTNEVLNAAFKNSKEKNSSIHFIGLLSDGGVHSDITHLFALLEKAKKEGLTKVYVHTLMDGRDTSPTSGVDYMKELSNKMKELNIGEVAVVSGRYYAMDRDNNYDRNVHAYNAIVKGEGKTASDPVELLKERYANNETDEFIKPTVILKDGKPVAKINENDSVIFFNFRPDRARQLAKTLINKVDSDATNTFQNITTPPIHFVSMTQYQEGLNDNIAYKPVPLVNTMGEIVSQNGLKQLRIAETEKYAHVTFFFNGGKETVFEGEDRILVPSPKECDGYYDRQPEMSAYKVTDKLLEALDSKKYDFIVLNFANMDMVGHTGVFEAATKAVEVIDECIGKLKEKVVSQGGVMLITADHGNADKMLEENGDVMTAHSLNPVRVVIVNLKRDFTMKDSGRLADLSPTVLDIMEIEQPAEMTGESLIK